MSRERLIEASRRRSSLTDDASVMRAKVQYNSQAEEYKRSKLKPWRRYCERYTAHLMLVGKEGGGVGAGAPL